MNNIKNVITKEKFEYYPCRIVSAFPGTGKTTYADNHYFMDSDSSNFSWSDKEKGIRHPDFPMNYIEHIIKNIGKYVFIFVSTHKEVRDALVANNIFHYVVYPKIDAKDEYIKRYEKRGNNDGFIKLLDENWNAWIQELQKTKYLHCCYAIEMEHKYLKDELDGRFVKHHLPPYNQ